MSWKCMKFFRYLKSLISWYVNVNYREHFQRVCLEFIRPFYEPIFTLNPFSVSHSYFSLLFKDSFPFNLFTHLSHAFVFQIFSFYLFSKMVSETFHGAEELLFVINEKLVNFAKLKNQGFDLMKDVLRQKWRGYFSMLNGLIYSNLVKEFWLYAYVGQDCWAIWYGYSLLCLLLLHHYHSLPIAAAIGFEEKGSAVEQYCFNSTFFSR